MKALPVGLRHRVVALTEYGLTSSEIAEVLVSSVWVRSIKQLHAAISDGTRFHRLTLLNSPQLEIVKQSSKLAILTHRSSPSFRELRSCTEGQKQGILIVVG